MGKATLIDRLRHVLAGIFFRAFLRCSGVTEKQYRKALFEDELYFRAKDRARIEKLIGALKRQTDNMAFILSQFYLHDFHGRFVRELSEDRATLSEAERNGV